MGKSPCIKPGSGAYFKDCPDCPEMVVVPAGSFLMGSPVDNVRVKALATEFHGFGLEKFITTS